MENKSKILAIDDNGVNTMILKELLDDDYNIKIANSGHEGLEMASQIRPDIILLDIMMPEIDGFEVCRKIRQNPELKYTKIIFVSAKTVLEDRLKGYEAGGDDYITKPFNNDELLAKVRVYIRLKAAEELDQMKSELTMSVTHELRTPLCITKNIISNLKAKVFGKLDEKVEDQLDHINENINRLAKIISNFLDVSSIDAGRMDIHYRQFAVQEVIHKTIKSLKILAQDKNIEILSDMPDNKIMIEADQDKFVQILTDLIENSIRYMGKDSGNVKIKLTESFNEIAVEVTDDGQGIEPNDLEKIFNRFVQVKRNVGPGEHGTGLGLTIVKGLIELHNGNITAQSQPGRGSTFTFTLPKTRSDACIEVTL